MQEKFFQVPLSEAEIALDERAYSDWIAGIEPQDFGPAPHNAELEKRIARARERWRTRALEKEHSAETELRARILKQRMARENSPLLFRAMQIAGVPVRALADGSMYHGEVCRKCSGTLRYLKNRKCVACAKTLNDKFNAMYVPDQALRAQRDNRAVAIKSGAAQFTGKACRKCGSTARLTRDARCVACTQKRNRRAA